MSLAAGNLDYGYRDCRVGSGVTLELAPGEVLCLLGPNGSGKTTLFKTLLGLLPPQAGSVLVNGVDARTLPRDVIARQLSYVPQAHGAFFPYTVHEIVLMGRTAHLGLFAAPSARDHAAALDAIRRMGIAHLADAVYTQISGGERQLALIARALAQDARLVVLDEPTASLDFGNQGRVLREIRRLAAAGLAVLFSTHDPNQALRIADRALLLGEGVPQALGRCDEVLDPARLERLYGVPVERLQAPQGGTAYLPSID